MVKKYFTTTPSQTKKLGEILAKKILKNSLFKTALIIGLEGDLGGGKTTFLQGFARGLRVKEKVLSPTFVLIKKFLLLKKTQKGGSGAKFQTFYHIDCYRIQKAKELLALEFKKIISNPQNIVAIEWADRVRQVLPKDIITLKFKFVDKKTRRIVILLKNGKR